MLVEVFENEAFEGQALRSTAIPSKGFLGAMFRFLGIQKNALELEDLQPLFEKIDLPLPELGKDISRTSEGGYNLMLNRYGAVLRLYPSEKGYGITGSRIGNMYHPSVLNSIGHVQFDKFAMQLVVGATHREYNGHEVSNASKKAILDTGRVLDFHDANLATFNGRMKLLDPVAKIDRYQYESYEAEGILAEILKENEPLNDLQDAFFEAWKNDDFAGFWNKMEEAKLSGLLCDGWNGSLYDMDLASKGNIIQLAAEYEAKLAAFRGEKPFVGPVNDDVYQVEMLKPVLDVR